MIECDLLHQIALLDVEDREHRPVVPNGRDRESLAVRAPGARRRDELQALEMRVDDAFGQRPNAPCRSSRPRRRPRSRVARGPTGTRSSIRQDSTRAPRSIRHVLCARQRRSHLRAAALVSIPSRVSRRQVTGRPAAPTRTTPRTARQPDRPVVFSITGIGPPPPVRPAKPIRCSIVPTVSSPNRPPMYAQKPCPNR